MSENEYQQLIERMLAHDATSPMISSETGVKAARKAGKLAAQEEIEWAIAGCLAMHFYGSPRITFEGFKSLSAKQPNGRWRS